MGCPSALGRRGDAMKLWRLEPFDFARSLPAGRCGRGVDPGEWRTYDPWEPPYDATLALTVIAPDEFIARRVAVEHEEYARPGPRAWLDAVMSTCREVEPAGPARVVDADVWTD